MTFEKTTRIGGKEATTRWPRPLLRIRSCMSCILSYISIFGRGLWICMCASQFLIILNMSYGRFYPKSLEWYLHTGSQTQSFRYHQPQQHSAFNYSQFPEGFPAISLLPRRDFCPGPVLQDQLETCPGPAICEELGVCLTSMKQFNNWPFGKMVEASPHFSYIQSNIFLHESERTTGEPSPSPLRL